MILTRQAGDDFGKTTELPRQPETRPAFIGLCFRRCAYTCERYHERKTGRYDPVLFQGINNNQESTHL